ncbi:hypothetical protein [Methylobacterium planeticum]|uniref:Uncharacterized protein n=1 Tax=Methylobacterium planeticum TaxID=2615211 RepID=A0A6N6MJ89_9HYPH|nr:hypothetical protein [Methylobacterium planeticum]KAB1071203.1 hypothetical protein F6X51_20130 [Methylobacterium planeticum]
MADPSDLRAIVPPPGHGGYFQTRPVTLRLEAFGGPAYVAVGAHPDPTREPRRLIQPGPTGAQEFTADRGAYLSAMLVAGIPAS